MSIWGKLAAAELLVAGPIAALLGGRAAPDDRDKRLDQLAENQVAFTVGVIVLSAKMAKADGVVTADEVNAFKACLLYTSPSPRDRQRSRMPSSA